MQFSKSAMAINMLSILCIDQYKLRKPQKCTRKMSGAQTLHKKGKSMARGWTHNVINLQQNVCAIISCKFSIAPRRAAHVQLQLIPICWRARGNFARRVIHTQKLVKQQMSLANNFITKTGARICHFQLD
jgi:hypothetical protein